MSHDMTRGGPCGRPGGHRGHHRSVAGVEQQRVAGRDRKREKRATDPDWVERHRAWDREYWVFRGYMKRLQREIVELEWQLLPIQNALKEEEHDGGAGHGDLPGTPRGV